jgi:antirestriction protein
MLLVSNRVGDVKNVTCKICKSEYHTCSSCAGELWEYDFCGPKCLQQHQGQGVGDVLSKYNLTMEQLVELLEELKPFHIETLY